MTPELNSPKVENTRSMTAALELAVYNSAYFSEICTDEHGVIQIFNVGAQRMLGYSSEEVVNAITPADLSDLDELTERATRLSLEYELPIKPGFEAMAFRASRGIEDIYELTYIRKDGTRLAAMVSVTALRDAGEVIIGYLLIGSDNTARKLVEAEQKALDQLVRDQQFYTRSLIESSIDPLLTTDARGIITDVNKQMEALTGCTRDELIGAPFKGYFTDEDAAVAAIRKVLTDRKVTDYELTARHTDGHETVVSYNLTTFYNRDRKLQGVFAAARDVTERKRLDQVLNEKNLELRVAREVADSANLSKSDFLSNMSHELRSPLNAILGFAQLLGSDLPPPTPSQQESVSQILQAGWHLLKLIDEILDLAKIESGRLTLQVESVELNEIVAECLAMNEMQAKKRGLTMAVADSEKSYLVSADPTRLKQVLINLLSNAIKYNRDGGAIVVSTSRPSPDRVRISVRDTGIGLTEGQVAQLFQPFNRLGQESGGIEGTGIGLVVARRLVELMRGVIGVRSTPDVGSEFWFELNTSFTPAMPSLAASNVAPSAARVRNGDALKVVLSIEDNPANMKLVARLIGRHPELRLISATTAMEGVELARNLRPTIILMDINLPDISGIAALGLLHRDPRTRDIPVVAISANAMPHDIERGLAAGFLRYLTKPINVPEFEATLGIALEQAELEESRND